VAYNPSCERYYLDGTAKKIVHDGNLKESLLDAFKRYNSYLLAIEKYKEDGSINVLDSQRKDKLAAILQRMN
jgi:hypothetical protein